MTAHLDSISTDSLNLAPGAEDNGSGVATLLEAARLFRHVQFDRTIKIIFFTGEEQGLYGSQAYVADHADEMASIAGVVNLDMFGYDADDDQCFELHVGTLTASDIVGQCFVNTISSYSLNLSYDYLTTSATTYSDHAPFWDMGVGAIEVLENFYDNGLPSGCVGSDRNPHYHKTTDTLDNMNLPTAFEIAKGGIATAAGLAGPMDACFAETPTLTAINGGSSINLTWTAVSGAESYLVYRSNEGCSGSWDLIATTESLTYQDTAAKPGTSTAYQVEAGASSGVCFSYPSSCQTATITGLDYFMPLLLKQQ
jgi:leucyl aminopeptidase